MLPCQTELLLGLGLSDSWSSLTTHIHCSFVSKPILTGPWEKSQDQAINTQLSCQPACPGKTARSGLFSDQSVLLTCNWFGDYQTLALYHALWTLFCPRIDVKTQKGAISPTFKGSLWLNQGPHIATSKRICKLYRQISQIAAPLFNSHTTAVNTVSSCHPLDI